MQRFEVLGVRLSRFVCLGAAALLAASLAAPRPAHATKSWTGSGGNANWSNNNNWNSNGGPPTTDGTGTADFVATNAGGRYTVSVNENTNCALQFDSGGTNGYTLNIGSNTMDFVNTATGADGSQIGVDTALTETLNGGTVNIADNITSDVVAGGMLAINGTITGDNNISMSGAGTVNISGTTTSGWGDFNGGFGGTNAGTSSRAERSQWATNPCSLSIFTMMVSHSRCRRQRRKPVISTWSTTATSTSPQPPLRWEAASLSTS